MAGSPAFFEERVRRDQRRVQAAETRKANATAGSLNRAGVPDAIRFK